MCHCARLGQFEKEPSSLRNEASSHGHAWAKQCAGDEIKQFWPAESKQQREVEGLTTAAGIWLRAAVGVAVGLGRLGLATVGTILTWIIMSLIGRTSDQCQSAPVKPARIG